MDTTYAVKYEQMRPLSKSSCSDYNMSIKNKYACKFATRNQLLLCMPKYRYINVYFK